MVTMKIDSGYINVSNGEWLRTARKAVQDILDSDADVLLWEDINKLIEERTAHLLTNKTVIEIKYDRRLYLTDWDYEIVLG